MPEQKPKITPDLFYKFFQCPHWIWYDIYGDATKKKEIPPLLDLIYKGKVANAGQVLGQPKKFEEVKPELMKDSEEAFLATLELMKQGKNIYHGVLMDEHWVGMPDLLEARPLRQDSGQAGKSNFGDWYYVVYDVQNSLDLRDEFKFQLVFYSLILGRLQGIRPKEAYVIDSQGNTRSFLADDYIEQFHLTRQQIEKILEGEKPAPFLKSGCRRAPWYSLCLSETQGCNDVSLIFRLSQSDQRHLYNLGIKTVADLANANIDELQSHLEDWPFDKIIRFNNQAKSLLNKEIIILKKPNFPKVENEIYFDVEGDPMRGIDYLLGILVKQTDNNKEPTYQYFLANDINEEGVVWKKFLDFFAGLDDFVIYHYAFYERQVFERMMHKYGGPDTLMNKFHENTIDIHAKLVESVVLPLYFYTLKDVAKYIGYTWSDADAGGAESVMWYNEWLDTKKDEIIKKILRYNEDDVRATLLVKEWLEKQKPHTSREKLPDA